MTELCEPIGEHDWRLADRRDRAARRRSTTAGVLDAVRRPRRHPRRRAGRRGRRAGAARGRARGARRTPRLGLPRPRDRSPRDRPRAAVARADVGRARSRRRRWSRPACVRWELGLLYLDRYHRLETQVTTTSPPGSRRRRPAVDEAAARGRRWRRSAPGTSAPSSEAAVVAAVRRRTTILTGGPGTGKTTTVARLLALLADQAAADGDRLCDRAGRADRQGGDPAPGGGRRRARPTSRGPGPRRRDLRRPARRADPAPAARLAPRQRDPLPARPRQPAQVRRGRRRRVLDGRADDDGPAARGAAARVPAGAGRRPATSSPRSARARCSATWSPATRAGPTRRSPRSPRTSGPRRTSSRSPRRCATATPTRCSRVLRAPSDQVVLRRGRRRGRDRGGAAARLGRRRPRGLGGRERRGPGPRAGRARPLPAAVRPPRGALRRTPLEPAGRALARRGDRRRPIWAAVVRRPPAAGDQQRLRARRLQRRDRRRRAAGRAAAARSSRARSGSSEFAPGRLDAVETMHAMTIHKSQGSQADRVDGAAARRGLAAADPRALLHRGHPGPASTCGSSAPRPPYAPRSGRRAQRATGLRLRLAGRLVDPADRR